MPLIRFKPEVLAAALRGQFRNFLSQAKYVFPSFGRLPCACRESGGHWPGEGRLGHKVHIAYAKSSTCPRFS